MTTKQAAQWLHWNGVTQADIARRLGVSRERVRQRLIQSIVRTPKRPGRKPTEDYQPPPRKRRVKLTAEDEWRIVQILRARMRWKW